MYVVYVYVMYVYLMYVYVMYVYYVMYLNAVCVYVMLVYVCVCMYLPYSSPWWHTNWKTRNISLHAHIVAQFHRQKAGKKRKDMSV